MIGEDVMDNERLLDFVTPFYAEKDIMHNMWHIELVIKYVNKIVDWGRYKVDYDKLIIAAYLHGFIYSHEELIKAWLAKQGFQDDDIQSIVKIAWESQRPETPETLEGKILHDAHIIEGGETYLLTKCLITGSVRNQTLLETIEFIEKYVIDKNKCYLPETIPILAKANGFAKSYIAKLKDDIT